MPTPIKASGHTTRSNQGTTASARRGGADDQEEDPEDDGPVVGLIAGDDRLVVGRFRDHDPGDEIDEQPDPGAEGQEDKAESEPERIDAGCGPSPPQTPPATLSVLDRRMVGVPVTSGATRSVGG